MSGALLAAALAVLAWPQPRAVRRVRPVRPAGPVALARRLAAGEVVPGPAVAAGVAAGATAVLSTPLVAALAGLIAGVAARGRQARARDRRTDGQLLALTEGLGALAAELRAGRPLASATTAAADACRGSDCGPLLAAAVRAPGTGSPEAGGELARTLDRIAAAVRLSARTGCSLAAVAAAVEDDLRARRRQRQELRSATAAPMASARLLAGLPLLGLAMGGAVGADPWWVLTTTGTGQVLLVAGVLLELAGLAWARRLIARAVP